MDQRRVPPNKSFTPEDDISMLRFLLETELVGGPFAMWKEFRAQTGNEKTVQCLNNRFKHYLSPNLHLANIDLEDKVKLYKKYNIAVDRGYGEVLKASAGIHIDDHGYIVQNEEFVAARPAARQASKRQPAIKGFAATPRVKRSKRPAAPVASSPIVSTTAPTTVTPQIIAPEMIVGDAFMAQIKNLVAETAKAVMSESIAEILAAKKRERVQVPLRNSKTDARNCLKDLKALVVNLNSSAMNDIEQRIDTAIQNCSDEKVSIDSIHGLLDVALKMHSI